MEEHKEHDQQQTGQQQQQSGGFKPKKIRHKMYGSKVATTEAEYTASKDDGWVDDDEPPAGTKPAPKR